MCSNVDDFKNKNLFSTAKLLKQIIDIVKKVLPQTLRDNCLIQYEIKTLLQQGISEPIIYGNYDFLFHCTTVGRAPDSMTALT